LNCYLNNLGIINSLGATKKTICENLLANNNSNMQCYDKLFSGKKTWVGSVNTPLADIPHHLAQYDCRNNRLIASAFLSIKDDIEKLKTQYGSARIGIVLGTSTSGISASEAAFKAKKLSGYFPESFNYQQQEIGTCADFLAQYADIKGPAYVISTACSSSGKAFSSACRLLENNICDVVITGGCDSLCEFTLNGFDSLEVIDENTCMPFSKNRHGINIGEGAALFIMSRESAPIELLGLGESSDAYHMSAPDPEAKGAKLAMNQALRSAGLSAKDIGYINMHGTGTRHNDKMESTAIAAIFPNSPYCSSTKPLTGHTLGAAGAQDLALCWLLLSDYNPQCYLPAQLSDLEDDDELEKINLLKKKVIYKQPIFMSNSFGFGGSNVSLIIGRSEHDNN
jgi:3-oxoacyl-[acyl-carrier-protein] synthase-1